MEDSRSVSSEIKPKICHHSPTDREIAKLKKSFKKKCSLNVCHVCPPKRLGSSSNSVKSNQDELSLAAGTMVCLHCGHLACVDHAGQHHRQLAHHCLVMKVPSFDSWCFKCKVSSGDVAVADSRTPEVMRLEYGKACLPGGEYTPIGSGLLAMVSTEADARLAAFQECQVILQTAGQAEKGREEKATAAASSEAVTAVKAGDLSGRRKAKDRLHRKEDSVTETMTGVTLILPAEGPESSSASSVQDRCRRVVGLVNLGNTCFFNSVVQNLAAMDSLRQAMMACTVSAPISSSLRKLFLDTGSVQEGPSVPPAKEDASSGSGFKKIVPAGVLNPRALLGAVCQKFPEFRGFQQHDSHELLRCLLDGLQGEQEASWKKPILEEQQQTLCEGKKKTLGVKKGGQPPPPPPPLPPPGKSRLKRPTALNPQPHDQGSQNPAGPGQDLNPNVQQCSTAPSIESQLPDSLNPGFLPSPEPPQPEAHLAGSNPSMQPPEATLNPESTLPDAVQGPEVSQPEPQLPASEPTCESQSGILQVGLESASLEVDPDAALEAMAETAAESDVGVIGEGVPQLEPWLSPAPEPSKPQDECLEPDPVPEPSPGSDSEGQAMAATSSPSFLPGQEASKKEAEAAVEEKKVTIVEALFGGQLASTVTCCTCGFSSVVLEPFLDLSLPIPGRIEEPARKNPASRRGKKAPPLSAKARGSKKDVSMERKGLAEEVLRLGGPLPDSASAAQEASQKEQLEIEVTDAFWAVEMSGEGSPKVQGCVERGPAPGLYSGPRAEAEDESRADIGPGAGVGSIQNSDAVSGGTESCNEPGLEGGPGAGMGRVVEDIQAEEEYPLLDLLMVMSESEIGSTLEVRAGTGREVEFSAEGGPGTEIGAATAPGVTPNTDLSHAHEPGLEISLDTEFSFAPTHTHEPGLGNGPGTDASAAPASTNGPGLENGPDTDASMAPTSTHELGLENGPDASVAPPPTHGPGLENCPDTDANLAPAPTHEPVLENGSDTDANSAPAPTHEPVLENDPDTDEGISAAPTHEPGVENGPDTDTSAAPAHGLESGPGTEMQEVTLELTPGQVYGPPPRPAEDPGNELQEEEDCAIADLFAIDEESTVAPAPSPAHQNDDFGDFIVEQLPHDDHPVSVTGCLDLFSKTELLAGDNQWGCNGCTKAAEGRLQEGAEGEESAGKVPIVKSDARKQILLKAFPRVLTVHLKRFKQDMRGRFTKIGGHVSFSEWLDIGPYALEIQPGSCRYRLTGVVEHQGTLRGGHYVSFVRAPDEGSPEGSKWFHVSDSMVRKSTTAELLSCEAYLLFYEREEP